jgi:benzylsuccinate CoA-transferase BbsE subunit
VIDTATASERVALGLAYDDLIGQLADDHPGLVQCTMTPFGLTGPRAGYAAHDLVLVAMGGNAAMTGDPARAPLRCSLPTSYFHAGPEAAVAILLALFARPMLGRGQLIDLSIQECQLSTLISGPGQYALTGRQGTRTGARTGRTREIWACADGWVSYGLRGGPARSANLAATVAYMHESGLAPEWLREMDWADYSPLTLSEDELDRIEDAFATFFASKTMRELYEVALDRRILLAPCNDAREILAQAQLRSRDFFERVEEGARSYERPAFFARSSCLRLGVGGAAPWVDADGEALRA